MSSGAPAPGWRGTVVELTTSKICPFAHRAWLTLHELGIPHVIKETSIAKGEKPAWFTAKYLSAIGSDQASDGKVPVLEVRREGEAPFILAESDVITDYLANANVMAGGGAAIMASSPEARAKAAIFVSQVGSKLVGSFYAVLSSENKEALTAARVKFDAALAAISAAYEAKGGPFFEGDRITTTDVLIWPWLSRLGVLTHFRGVDIPAGPEYAALQRFVAAMLARPSVQATQLPPEPLIEAYKGYAKDTIIKE